MTTKGDVKYNAEGGQIAFRSVCLFTGLTTTNGQPSSPTDGVPVYAQPVAGGSGASFLSDASQEAILFMACVGSATPSITLRLWGYLASLNGGTWVPVGATPAGDTTKGQLNNGVAIGPTKTNTILHCEPVLLAGLFDDLYLEVVAISGTGATAEAWLTTPLHRAF